MNFTVTLSEAEFKAFSHVAIDPQAWIDNVVHERCRVAIDEIVNKEIARKLEIGEQIPPNKIDIVMQADLKTAAEIFAEEIERAQLEAQRVGE